MRGKSYDVCNADREFIEGLKVFGVGVWKSKWKYI